MKKRLENINSLKRKKKKFYKTYSKRRKRKDLRDEFDFKRICISLAIFIFGLIIFSYPIISSYLSEKNQASIIENYDSIVKNQDDEYFEQELHKAIEYNESLAGDPVRDPFVFNSGYALPENYMSVLNVNGVMGYINIPKINVRLPIYHGSSEETLAKGVGHIESTSLPVGGSTSHAVLTGHRGLPNAKLFTDLNLLKRGDHFYISFLNQTIAYKVDQIKTILPSELKDLIIVPDKDYITLVTCTPYGINTHRLIVRGIRTEYIPENVELEAPHIVDKIRTNSYQIAGIIIGLIILIIGCIIYSYFRRKKIKTQKRKMAQELIKEKKLQAKKKSEEKKKYKARQRNVKKGRKKK